MFLILIRRELLANLIAFRFSVAMIICLLLVVANTSVLIDDYERRLASYNTALITHREESLLAKTYSFLRLNVDRPPNPLSIFNQGLDRHLGNTINVYHGAVPSLWDTESHGSDNPFLGILSSIDLAFIFQIVLSLLALLFAYDAIAGEHEDGTLRLMLSNSISRSLILLAKYISAMVCLILPLIVSLFAALILFTEADSISLGAADWIRICGIIFTTIVYLSVFYLIGLLISATARSTATTLMLSIFVWALLTLIYPSVSVFATHQLWNTQDTLAAAHDEITQIWERFEKERMDFLKNDPVEGEDRRFNMRAYGSSDHAYYPDLMRLQHIKLESNDWVQIANESEAQIPYVKAYYQFLEPLRIKAAERTWLVRQKALEQTYVRRAKIVQHFMQLSPAAIYDLTTEALAGVDLREIQNFITQVQQYRQTVITYFYDKDTFSSRQWFASDKGEVQWNDLPVFSYQRVSIWESVRHALPYLVLLLLINTFLFMATFLIFTKQEV